MDFLPEYETFSLWLIHYGSFVLFILLALGIVALPVPEETLMVISGILMYKGHLYIPHTIIAALGGSVCGITMSYLLGSTAGYYFIHKYGPTIGLTERRLQKVHEWFERFGKWTLFVGYFIPGVRHFTGLVAGMTELKFKQFALFAYPGATLWVATFLSIGYFLGNVSLDKLPHIEFGLDEISIIALISLIGIMIYKYRHKFRA